MKSSQRRRLLKGLGLVLFLLIVAAYIGLPAIMAVAVIIPSGGGGGGPPPPRRRGGGGGAPQTKKRGAGGGAPDGFSEVSLVTDDNITLAAWYAEPQNGAVVILVHGAGDGRGAVRDYATMLHRNGFGVLALNLRGHGDSEGRVNKLGWNGTRDVGAAMAFLAGREEVRHIGGLGLSLGGEVLLGASGAYAAIQAIVADGATFREVSEYTSLPANRSLVRSFVQHVFTGMVRLLTGDTPPQPTLIEAMQQTTDTTFLFVAASRDSTEVTYNEYFHETLSQRSQLWVVPEASHIGAFGLYPAEYEQRIIDFFSRELLGS